MPTLGDRLRHARERAGLTLQQVEDRTQIGRSSISEYEADKREPRMRQLAAFAQVYHRAISFFVSDEPIPSEGVLWRDGPEEASEIEVEFLRLCQQYRNLEVWCDAVSEIRLPETKKPLSEFSRRDAEELAKETRRELELGDRPGNGLRRTLEEVCGIKVFYRDFEGASAASTWSDAFGPAILLNSRNVPWRRTFDLAHELFHIVTWRSFRGGADSTSFAANDEEEKLANCFASHFLMPAEATRSAVNASLEDGRISVDSLEDIARQFDVSVQALLYRIRALYNLDWDRTKVLADQITAVRSSRKHMGDDPPRYPARYEELAIRALRKGEVSLGRFAQYLDLTRNEARQYLPSENDSDAEEIEIASA